jgi:hypothetical protein
MLKPYTFYPATSNGLILKLREKKKKRKKKEHHFTVFVSIQKSTVVRPNIQTSNEKKKKLKSAKQAGARRFSFTTPFEAQRIDKKKKKRNVWPNSCISNVPCNKCLCMHCGK